MTSRLKPQDGFQSTLSMRRATREGAHLVRMEVISIHALHEESDNGEWGIFNPTVSFQSTLSMRRATLPDNAVERFSSFQSTLSMRRATVRANSSISSAEFQSTLSMRRATVRGMRIIRIAGDFNPRSP